MAVGLGGCQVEKRVVMLDDTAGPACRAEVGVWQSQNSDRKQEMGEGEGCKCAEDKGRGLN